MLRTDARFTTVNEPFNPDRDPARMLFDFGAMLSCLTALESGNRRVLDFCAGSGWIAEFLNRMGYDVSAVDLNADGGAVLGLRARCDERVDASAIAFSHGDGHALPYADGFFGHLCCFDSLHHMHDYARTLREMARVLEPGGRAVFVEPGAMHSRSPATIAFIRAHKSDDPTWIERDVVIEEIDGLAREAGFEGLVIRPHLPAGLIEYPLPLWQKFRAGHEGLASQYLAALRSVNYDERVVFYLQRKR